jgi:hypothetical protein
MKHSVSETEYPQDGWQASFFKENDLELNP